MSKKLIIAVVGMCGSGKSKVTEILRNSLKVEALYLGGIVLKEIEKKNLEVTSENEKTVREELRKEKGMGVLAELIIPYIDEINTSVILDGLYSFSEYEILKKRYSQNFKVLAVHTNKGLRYSRLSKREIRPLSSDQVDDRDYSEIKNIEKGGPIAIADFHIINNGTEKELEIKILDEIVSICSQH